MPDGSDRQGALADLLAGLEAAAAAAESIAGEPAMGIRAVEDRPGERAYLCALPGPRFICLSSDLAPIERRDAALEVTSAALLVEHSDELLDEGRLQALAAAARRVLSAARPADAVEEAVGEVAERAVELADWSAAPARALASIPALDEAVVRHDELMVAWSTFVRASEPLAAAQERLSAEALDALRGLEEAAGAAGVATPLTGQLADALPRCRAGAREMLEHHVTALAG